MSIGALLKECLAAFIGTVAFALLFSAPRKYYAWCGFIGMAGWVCFRLLQAPTGRMASVFLASVLVVFLSRMCAVWESCPVTIFMVAGLFPLVPGAGIYWTVYELVMKNAAEAISRGFVALQDAVAIVLGIIAVFELPQKVFAVVRRRGKKTE